MKRKRPITVMPDRFTKHLTDDVVLKVGPYEFSRQDMVDHLRCGNYNAATRLTKNLQRLKVTNAGELHKIGPHSLYRSEGIGDAQVFVAMCFLHFCNYDVEKWWGWKPTKKQKEHKQPIKELV